MGLQLFSESPFVGKSGGTHIDGPKKTVDLEEIKVLDMDAIAAINARADAMRKAAKALKPAGANNVVWLSPQPATGTAQSWPTDELAKKERVVSVTQVRYEELLIKEEQYDILIGNMRRFMIKVEQNCPDLFDEFCEVFNARSE